MFVALALSAAAVVPKPAAIDPRSWFSAEDYPIEAAKNGVEGSVTFDVGVDRAGNPTSCRIVASSGSKILDQATCKAVLRKAKFTPAIGRDGQPVASHYSQKASWRVPNKSTASYRAAILDFGADPLHPLCTIQSKGDGGTGPTCADLQAQLSSIALSQNISKFVYLLSTSPGDEVPYRGESDWGHRVSYLAADQYYLKGSFPIACITVAAEGPPGHDPCAGFPGRRALSDVEKQQATRTRVETSLFVIRREGAADTTAQKR